MVAAVTYFILCAIATMYVKYNHKERCTYIVYRRARSLLMFKVFSLLYNVRHLYADLTRKGVLHLYEAHNVSEDAWLIRVTYTCMLKTYLSNNNKTTKVNTTKTITVMTYCNYIAMRVLYIL